MISNSSSLQLVEEQLSLALVGMYLRTSSKEGIDHWANETKPPAQQTHICHPAKSKMEYQVLSNTGTTLLRLQDQITCQCSKCQEEILSGWKTLNTTIKELQQTIIYRMVFNPPFKKAADLILRVPVRFHSYSCLPSIRLLPNKDQLSCKSIKSEP
jgi:hypothetical protein